MPKKTEKRVKAWATVIPNWKGSSIGDVFLFEDEALAQAKKNQLHKKVIPCTITYSLPSQGKGKKK